MIRLSAIASFLIFFSASLAQAQSKTIDDVTDNIRDDLFDSSNEYNLQKVLFSQAESIRNPAYTYMNRPCFEGNNQTYGYEFSGGFDTPSGNFMRCIKEADFCGVGFLVGDLSSANLAKIYTDPNYQTCTKEMWALALKKDWNGLVALPRKYWAIHNGYSQPDSLPERRGMSPQPGPSRPKPPQNDDGYNDIDDLSTDDIEILDDTTPAPRSTSSRSREPLAQSQSRPNANTNPLYQRPDRYCIAQEKPREVIVKDPICICGYGAIDVFGVEAASGYSECRWGPKWKVEPR